MGTDVQDFTLSITIKSTTQRNALEIANNVYKNGRSNWGRGAVGEEFVLTTSDGTPVKQRWTVQEVLGTKVVATINSAKAVYTVFQVGEDDFRVVRRPLDSTENELVTQRSSYGTAATEAVFSNTHSALSHVGGIVSGEDSMAAAEKVQAERDAKRGTGRDAIGLIFKERDDGGVIFGRSGY